MWNLLHRIFIENFPLKLASLLLAVGLWLLVARDPIAEVEMRVPIELNNLGNMEVDSRNFSESQVRVRGPERLIHRLREGDVWVRVDIAGVTPGERTFDLTPRQVHVPQDLEVVQVIPGQFQLSFDVRTTRTVPVQPRVMGTFAGGMRIGEVVAEPGKIVITGPRRRVDAVDSATTDPVDASGTMARASFVTHAFVSDPLIQVVHPTPIRVTVIMEREGEDKKTD
jgi:YbbR domain-containing protein